MYNNKSSRIVPKFLARQKRNDVLDQSQYVEMLFPQNDRLWRKSKFVVKALPGGGVALPTGGGGVPRPGGYWVGAPAMLAVAATAAAATVPLPCGVMT